MNFLKVFAAGLVLSGPVFTPRPAVAQEILKVVTSQRGVWDSAIPELGRDAGLFKKRGLQLDILYTQGGGETQQAVVSNSVDLGIAVGTLGVLGAYAKGAPLRVIGAEATGMADFWYVRADSKLQSIKDADANTTIAYSTNGSSTNMTVLAFLKEYNLRAKPVATGGP